MSKKLNIDTSLLGDAGVEELERSFYQAKDLKGTFIACDAEDIDLLIIPLDSVREIGNDRYLGTYVKYEDGGDLGIITCPITSYIIIK